MNKILLQGCQSKPLAGYLKALGVLRIIAEQVDSKVLGAWTEQGFQIKTKLTREELASFFCERYIPTPVIAPWNGGSGFYPKDNKDALKAIVENKSTRFFEYQAAIATAQKSVSAESLSESPKVPEVKNRLLNHLRAELNEAALHWLDAALTLNGDKQKFPPLLGTGGNDGRLDFSNNFMQRLVSLISENGSATDTSANNLSQAMFDESAFYIKRNTIGQFSPMAAGSYNGSTGFDSNATASPWDFVLMIEGAMMFASAASRRLDSHAVGATSFPFSTRSIGAGSGATHVADESEARAELWLPLWRNWAGIFDLKQLFREGRVTLGRKSPRDGLEFARAVSQLGNTRGIEAYERYTFLMRSGKAYVATPIGRFVVPKSPRKNLLIELEKNRWLASFDAACRDKNAPARLRGLQAPLRDKMFALTQADDVDRSDRCQAILKQLGEIDRYSARSAVFRENVKPLKSLGEKWAIAANSDSVEYRIAAAIATLHVGGGEFTVRQLISPAVEGEWQKGTSRDVCWQHPSATHCMNRALDRLSLRAFQAKDPDHGFSSKRGCDLEAISQWLKGDCDDNEIHTLVPGLSLLGESWQDRATDESKHSSVPTAYSVLKLCFCGNSQLRANGLLPEGVSLPNPRPIIRYLHSGDVARAVKLATRSLRIVGLEVPAALHSDLDPARLSAALLIPISDSSVKVLAIALRLKHYKYQTNKLENPNET